MKIGELLIALGFRIEGDKDLQTVERGMLRATGSATKLAIEVAALNAAFLYMIEQSLKAAVALRTFSLTTALSTDELQDWEHRAQVNGLAAGTLTDAIKELQTARTNFALGNPQAVGAWTLLGVDPRQDPFRVLDAMRLRLQGIKDVGVARNLLGQVGLEALLPLLRSSNAEWEKWSRNFIVTGEQTAKLAKLNAAWQSLKLSVSSAAIQLSSLFTPALGALARALEWVADRAALFVRWLQTSDPLANLLRRGIQLLAVALLGLGVILAGLVAIMGTFAAVIGFLSWGFTSLLAALAPFLLTAGLLVGVVAALVLVLNDWWVAINGGKSALNWDWSIERVNDLAKAIERVIALWKSAKALFSVRGIEGILFPGFSPDHGVPNASYGHVGGSRVEMNNEINIHETAGPRATGREVQRNMQDLYRGALNQAPVRSY